MDNMIFHLKFYFPILILKLAYHASKYIEVDTDQVLKGER